MTIFKKIVFVFVLLFVNIYNIYARYKNHNEDSIVEIKFTFKLPVVNSDGNLNYITDSIFIQYHRNYILYKLPYTHLIDSNNVLLSTKKKYSYFIYKKNEKNGIEFKSLKDTVGVNQVVDSILSERAFLGSKFLNEKDSLVKTICDTKYPEILTKVFIQKKGALESYSDTTYLSFRKDYVGIDFSLSKELDIQNNSKLFYAAFRYKRKFSPTYKITLPERELSFEIKKLSNPSKEILLFSSLTRTNIITNH